MWVMGNDFVAVFSLVRQFRRSLALDYKLDVLMWGWPLSLCLLVLIDYFAPWFSLVFDMLPFLLLLHILQFLLLDR
jgi:hypothetical protein